ncbi:arsenate reductase ArsC [Cryobacterium sp. TMT2-10]|uniref:Arsenate reductase ArsC n=1 Tax=Cryobacterium shii TaxID=1259235 RepID=A0AAQ2HF68_9MICO|nr:MULTISPECIES: arsenate reductase ArsC [Cryobacterium]TFC43600.1 arsenate reductase ArsC [Cryobacterium shii]TFC85973.1 arsenate reductase ArsC [Cryobacterium sp. TmT2-59]TFD19770.1 arsenate reductase ArsC [Cryobacterium sp. TMT2-23]TFD39867.1 arsenate reductase ArsC [Cryobacterium sp. TMT2-10]
MSDTGARRSLPGLTYPEEYLKRLARDLTVRFAGVFSAETVERYVLESFTALLRTSTVKAHLATNTIRFATDRVTALAQAKGAIARSVPEVLFVCEQNAGRSQMAAVFTNALSGGAVHVRSAGSAPSREVNPTVAAAMAEIGLDFTEAFPKPLTDDVVQAADVVITMGCGDACPVYPGKTYQDWALTDPAGRSLEKVRVIRDEITDRVERLLDTLTPRDR